MVENPDQTIEAARDFAIVKGQVNPARIQLLKDNGSPHMTVYWQRVVDGVYVLGLERNDPYIWVRMHAMITNAHQTGGTTLGAYLEAFPDEDVSTEKSLLYKAREIEVNLIEQGIISEDDHTLLSHGTEFLKRQFEVNI